MMFRIPPDAYFKLVGFELLEFRAFCGHDLVAIRRAWEELSDLKAMHDDNLRKNSRYFPAILSVWNRPLALGPWDMVPEIGKSCLGEWAIEDEIAP